MGVSQPGQNVSTREALNTTQTRLSVPGLNILPPLLHTSYTKPKGQLPDYMTPVVLQQGKSSVEELCNSIHKGIMREFKQ